MRSEVLLAGSVEQPQARPGSLLGCLSSTLLVPEILLGHRPTAPLISGVLLGWHTQPTALLIVWGFAEPAHTKGESMQEMYFFFIDCCHYSRARATTKSAYESSRLDSWFISPPPQRTTQPAFFNLSLRNTPWPVLVLSAFSHAATTWVSANCHCSGGSIRLPSCHVIKFRSSSCLGQVLDSWPVLLNLPLVVCFFFASFVVPAEPQQAFFLVKREKGIISWLYAPVVAGKGEPGTPQVQCAPPSWP